ncbi:hypothetical protein [Paenibacillus ehimensis]|nr:hypothetical protein [Paenibacillus ehimensis]
MKGIFFAVLVTTALFSGFIAEEVGHKVADEHGVGYLATLDEHGVGY